MDVACPAQAFDIATSNGQRMYGQRYVSVDGNPVRANCGLRLVPDAKISEDSIADDLLVPGGEGVDALLDNNQLKTVIRGWQERGRGNRLISVCSGALLLAAAGVLNGKSATTHWSRRSQVLRRFPAVRWQLDTLFTLSEQLCTSAGVSAGIDLALAIIRHDCGPRTALEVAQELVVFLQRAGGQSQFSDLVRGQFELDKGLAEVVDVVVNKPNYDWTLGRMADLAAVSSRTLSRRFSRSLGISPMQFVEKTRVNHARALLAGGTPVHRVASQSGFDDIQRMRRSFKRQLGVNVADYIRRFVPVRPWPVSG